MRKGCPLFNFRLAQEFRKRAADMIGPFPRGVVPTSTAVSSGFESSRMGAYSALGAIGLGGVMLVANIAHNRCDVPVAALSAESPVAASQPSKAAAAAKVVSAPEPDVNSVAAAPATPIASPVAATDKSTARVDTSTTGAISTETPAHPKHKPRLKKAKDLDSRN